MTCREAKGEDFITFSDNQGLILLENGEKIGNFKPKVIKRIYDRENKTYYVKITLLLPNGIESDEITIPLKKLASIDWQELDYRCIIEPNCRKAGAYIEKLIRTEMQNVSEVTELHIDAVGTHFVDGVVVFCTGDQIIKPPEAKIATEITIDSKLPKLAVDPNYSEKESVIGMQKIISLSYNAGRIILAHSILYVTRELFIAAGVIPRCILFLFGPPSTFKTTYAAFQTQLYDRDKGIASPMRCNSTATAAEAYLLEMNDCVRVIDDLFPADSSEIKRNQEKTLGELVRIVGDNVSKSRMVGGKRVSREPRCGLVATGEYLIGTGSDAARLLPIQFTKPIDGIKLSEIQNEPLVLSTFYFYFIKWYISNYGEILNLTKARLSDFRKVKICKNARLQETFFCINAAYMLYLQYCHEIGLATTNALREEQMDFEKSLLMLIKKQNERVEMGGNRDISKLNCLEVIHEIYSSGGFSLAKNIGQLRDRHDGLIYDNCLCLRSAKLMEKIREYDPVITLDNVINELLAQDALKRGSEKSAIQISGGKGKRFLAISLKKLKFK